MYFELSLYHYILFIRFVVVFFGAVCARSFMDKFYLEKS